MIKHFNTSNPTNGTIMSLRALLKLRYLFKQWIKYCKSDIAGIHYIIVQLVVRKAKMMTW